MNILNINIDKMNNDIETKYEEYIFSCETYYKNQIKELVEQIKLSTNIRFILLAGPSSSGKTTTAKLLKQELIDNGYNTKTISLDDFFVEREDTPLWECGRPNYESIDAIDWKLFDKCITTLQQEHSALMPTYDFITGKKIYQSTLTLDEKDIVIIEGLHSLNPVLDNYIPKGISIKVFLEPMVEYYKNDKLVLNGKELRFFRRLIRDIYTRGSTPARTLDEWNDVMKGEQLYITPFKNSANFTINTCHPYEICIYKSIVKYLEIDKIEDYKKLLEPFSYFVSLNKNTMPVGSLLQEFIH